jgi:hypothetical protein
MEAQGSSFMFFVRLRISFPDLKEMKRHFFLRSQYKNLAALPF